MTKKSIAFSIAMFGLGGEVSDAIRDFYFGKSPMYPVFISFFIIWIVGFIFYLYLKED